MTPVKIPSKATLDKYGLDRKAFQELAVMGKHGCWICGGLPASRRLAIDHEHVRGFKAMNRWQKAMYVRGLACYRCNRFKIGQNTLDSAKAVCEYLLAYQNRRQK